MDIVTIGCSRDKSDLLVQAYSIDRYITNPTNHWIVIEDGSLSEQEWTELLSPYYTRHTLKLHMSERDPALAKQFESDGRFGAGWRRQQILKLETTAKHVKTDRALVLDSKNIFVGDIDLRNWPIKHGNGRYLSWDKISNDINYISIKCWLKYVSEVTGRPVPSRVSGILETPFVWHTETIRTLWEEFDVYEHMLNPVVLPNSEFHTYHFYVDQSDLDEEKEVICCTEMSWDIPTDVNWLEYVEKRIKLCEDIGSPSHGFHGRERRKFTLDASIRYIEWLVSRGFDSTMANEYMFNGPFV